MMRYIILVSGFSKSGKDTFSDFLVKHNYTKYAFADELKSYISEKYNIDYKLTLTQEGKNTKFNILNENVSIRDILIFEADNFRKINPDYYAIKVSEKIKMFDKIKDYRGELTSGIVISDFRYLNEYNFIKNEFKNFKIITVRINRHDTSPVNSETEHYLDNFNFNYTIDNKNSITDFYNNIMTKLYFLFD